MHKSGNNWSITTYGVSFEVAQKFEEARKKTRLSESSYLASVLEDVFLPDSVVPEGR